MAAAVAHSEGFFPARDNLRLFWQSFVPENPTGHVAVIHGYADHSHRYMHVFAEMNRQGLAAHGFDYRGHGQADGRRGHVDHFSDYLDDTTLFLDRVAGAAGNLPVFVLGHSHGALIAARLLLDRPRPLSGVIYTSPYMRLAFPTPRIKVAAARVFDRVLPWKAFENQLRPQDLTHDPEIQRATASDPLYNRTTTPRWFFESTAAQEVVLARAPELKQPSLVCIGESDPIADPAAGRLFFERLGAQDKRLCTYPGALHEIMNESEPTRGRVFADVASFLHTHGAGSEASAR